jgi:hypothetical protein
MLFVGEHSLLLAYYLQDHEVAGEDRCAVVSFKRAYVHMFGPPNDEAFSGHPLAARGLQPYSAYEIEHSSWVNELERMNSVHPYHRPECFASYKHYIFSFHDTTFECVAEGFTLSEHAGYPSAVLIRVQSEA